MKVQLMEEWGIQLGKLDYSNYDEYGDEEVRGARRVGVTKRDVKGKRKGDRKRDHVHEYVIVRFDESDVLGYPGDDNVMYVGMNVYECTDCGNERSEYVRINEKEYLKLRDRGLLGRRK